MAGGGGKDAQKCAVQCAVHSARLLQGPAAYSGYGGGGREGGEAAQGQVPPSRSAPHRTAPGCTSTGGGSGGRSPPLRAFTAWMRMPAATSGDRKGRSTCEAQKQQQGKGSMEADKATAQHTLNDACSCSGEPPIMPPPPPPPQPTPHSHRQVLLEELEAPALHGRSVSLDRSVVSQALQLLPPATAAAALELDGSGSIGGLVISPSGCRRNCRLEPLGRALQRHPGAGGPGCRLLACGATCSISAEVSAAARGEEEM